MSEVQSGMSQKGNPWYRQTIVVDVAGYNGSFRKLALQASGDSVQDLANMQIGDKVDITYQVTAREYNGKWYNNVDLFRIELQNEEPVQQQVYTQPVQQTQPAPRQRVRTQSSPLIPPGENLSPVAGDLPW